MSQPIDAYCERLDPSFWAEPVNAVTNAGFLVAACVMAMRLRGSDLPLAWTLIVLLALIGIGSFLFHTFARPWAALADVIPIVLFVLVYIYAASRDFLELKPIWSLVAVLAFLPCAAVLIPLLQHVPLLGVSAAYLPVPLMIILYALLLRRQPELARGLAIGAGLLLLSLTLRSLDLQLCPSFPLGTHFAWHLLNAVMLGWMIEVYRRHRLAQFGHQS